MWLSCSHNSTYLGLHLSPFTFSRYSWQACLSNSSAFANWCKQQLSDTEEHCALKVGSYCCVVASWTSRSLCQLQAYRLSYLCSWTCFLHGITVSGAVMLIFPFPAILFPSQCVIVCFSLYSKAHLQCFTLCSVAPFPKNIPFWMKVSSSMCIFVTLIQCALQHVCICSMRGSSRYQISSIM